jgi:hypothetical protein
MQTIKSVSESQKIHNKRMEDAKNDDAGAMDNMSFHDRIAADFKKNPEPFSRYGKAIQQGAERARKTQAAYRDHNHPEHEQAKAEYAKHDRNFDLMQDAMVEDAIKATGAKKLESRNMAYEEKIYDAIRGKAGDLDDAGIAAKARASMKKKHFDKGYDNPDDATHMEQFLAGDYLSTGQACVDRIRKIQDTHFGDAKRRLVQSALGGNPVSDKMKALREKEAKKNETPQQEG